MASLLPSGAVGDQFHLPVHLTYDDYLVLPLLFFTVACYLNRRILWRKPDPYYYKWFEVPQNATRQSTQTSGRTRNLQEKLADADLDLVIFWGSQSGTAEGLAYRVAKELRVRFGAESLVADLSDYDINTISLVDKSKVFVFIMSTYGEGEPSDNAIAFLNFLRNAPSSCMLGLRYGAFGLGNSNYRFYNRVIDEVTGLLDGLGAVPLLPVGKGNEASRSTEEDFTEFKEKLFASMASDLKLEEHEATYIPSIEIVEDESVSLDGIPLASPFRQSSSSKSVSAIAVLPVPYRRDLVTTTFTYRRCIHMELDLSIYPKIKYKTGDHIAIWPRNPEEEVSRILQVLGLETRKDNPIRCQSCSGQYDPLNIPSPTTIAALFRHHLEICAPVSREIVLTLTQFANTDRAKSLLHSLGGDRVAYAEFLKSNHLTFARLLQYVATNDPEVSWSDLPLSFVLESLPPLVPRYYSISSSSITSPRQLSITVAVKDMPLLARPETKVPGLTSTYLSKLDVVSTTHLLQTTDESLLPRLHAQIRHSSFKLPASSAVPLIMVAAGTGIAPFRGFLQERARLAATGRTIGSMLLFFGCEHPEHDFLYKDELNELALGPLRRRLEMFVAFSRVGAEKEYVQHRIQKECESVMRLLLEEDASFYVCGSVKMAKAVENVITERIEQAKRWSKSEVEAWRLGRRKAKRWQEDIWA